MNRLIVSRYAVQIIAVVLFAFPIVSYAAVATTFTPLIPLAGSGNICDCTSFEGSGSAPDWGCVLQTIQTGMTDLVLLGTILITVYIAWAGIAYLTAPINAEARSAAKKRIVNAAIGLVIVLCAWLLVDSLMKVIYNSSATVIDGTANGTTGQAQLGPWNAILSGGNNSYCITIRFTNYQLPGLGLNNGIVATQNGSGGQGASTPSTASTQPSGTCGQNTHLNCAAAVQWLQNNVHTTADSSSCLHYIRQALSAGGVSLSCGAPPGHSEWAGYCNPALQALNFTSLGSSDPNPQPGDILVIQHSTGTQIGHITMWTGSAWVSDFIQSNGESPPGNPYGSAGYNPEYWRP